MFALTYISNAIQRFDERSLRQLEEHAARKNQRLDLTGYLNYSRGVFFQHLEGEKQTVLDLMEVIGLDLRHRVTNVVHLGEFEERFFPDWRMRYVTPEEIRTVRMEDVLERVLMTMTGNVFEETMVRDTVLRLVKKLSGLRTQLPVTA